MSFWDSHIKTVSIPEMTTVDNERVYYKTYLSDTFLLMKSIIRKTGVYIALTLFTLKFFKC